MVMKKFKFGSNILKLNLCGKRFNISIDEALFAKCGEIRREAVRRLKELYEYLPENGGFIRNTAVEKNEKIKTLEGSEDADNARNSRDAQSSEIADGFNSPASIKSAEIAETIGTSVNAANAEYAELDEVCRFLADSIDKILGSGAAAKIFGEQTVTIMRLTDLLGYIIDEISAATETAFGGK